MYHSAPDRALYNLNKFLEKQSITNPNTKMHVTSAFKKFLIRGQKEEAHANTWTQSPKNASKLDIK